MELVLLDSERLKEADSCDPHYKCSKNLEKPDIVGGCGWQWCSE